jgi:hypothetical protein
MKTTVNKMSQIPNIHTLLLTKGFEATISFYCTLFVFVDD